MKVFSESGIGRSDRTTVLRCLPLLRHAKWGGAMGLSLVIVASRVSASTIELHGTRHDDYRGTPKLDFPSSPAARVNSAWEYLRSQAADFGLPSDLANLEPVAVRKSLLGTHTRYRQVLNGIPIDGAEIVVSQRKTDGSVFQVYNNTYPIKVPVPVVRNAIGREIALQKAWDHLRVHGRLHAPPRADLLYMPEKTGFRLVFKTLLIVGAPRGYWEHKIDALTGEVLSVRRHEISEKYAADDVPDFTAYRGPVASLREETLRLETALKAAEGPVTPAATVDGSALVFDPDPRTTLMNDGLLDTSSAATFNPAYFTRTLREITLESGTYRLRGPWVTVTNVASELPATAVSTTTNGIWTAKRGTNAFNDVMCYFHIDQNQRYLQSLGYTGQAGIQAVSIPVDSDGVNGDDNSHYVPAQNLLAFGHGGVDDDEDADVILHEYGHAITYDTTPSFGGGDSGAIGEGFGDYWGASYSWTTTNGATHHPEWAFSWDGHGPDTWTGRFLDKTNLTYNHATTYVAHQTINGIANYSDQLWGTPLFQAFRDLVARGRPPMEMDTIVIESFFGVGSGVKMRDMANSTVKAAMELYPAGPHASVYYTRFTNQLILVAFPLPDPTLTYPTGGEVFATGAVVNIQWNRNGALTNAAAKIEFTSSLNGDAQFSDNVESGTNGWVPSKQGLGSDWYITTSSNHSPTKSWFAADNTVTGDQFLARSSVAVSNGAVLSFWHCYNLEAGFDGAVVEISTNGTTWVDLGANATTGGYTHTISSGYGNPIAGRPAFSGSSGGFIETRIPLDSYAGQTVSIRFRESDDNSAALTGWWVDDIRIASLSWSALATAPANASNHWWTLPGAPGTNYAVRVKLTGSNCVDSGWAASPAFTVSSPSNRAPTNITLSASTVHENQSIGTTVGVLTTQDPDAGNTFAYTLVAGTGSGDNSSFIINASNLETAGFFNYEIKSQYSIRVQSTDQGGLSTQKVFVINVTDVDETPVILGLDLLDETNVVLRWSSVTNHLYTVRYSTNLMLDFSVLQSNITATPVVNSYTDSVQGVPQKFWQIITAP